MDEASDEERVARDLANQKAAVQNIRAEQARRKFKRARTRHQLAVGFATALPFDVGVHIASFAQIQLHISRSSIDEIERIFLGFLRPVRCESHAHDSSSCTKMASRSNSSAAEDRQAEETAHGDDGSTEAAEPALPTVGGGEVKGGNGGKGEKGGNGGGSHTICTNCV